MNMRKKMTDIAVNGLVAVLDFGVGMLIVACLAQKFGVDVALWHLAVGGLLALLPDTDVIWPILFEGEITFNHRTSIMHRPLVVIPIATIIAALYFGSFWAVVTFLCILWHFVHDSPPLNNGRIDWWWPLEGKRTLMPDYRAPEVHQKWLEEWRTPTKQSLTELSIGLVCIGAALWLYTGTHKHTLITVSVLAAGIASVWYFARYTT